LVSYLFKQVLPHRPEVPDPGNEGGPQQFGGEAGYFLLDQARNKA